MIVSIQPSKIMGSTQAPASKSSMQRACAAALLRKGVSILHNAGHSHDDLSALDTIRKLGARLDEGELDGDRILTIHSLGVHPVSGEINCGESGLGVRMFTPIAALSELPLVINGKGSLLTRPLQFFDDIFPQLGIEITSNKGFLPLSIRGPLRPASITVDGSLSSQFLTGLLMAFAAAGAGDAVITVNDLKSKPYIDLTLSVLKDFGWNVSHKGYKTFHFDGGQGMSGTGPTGSATAGSASAGLAGSGFAAGTGSIAGPARSTLHYTIEGDWSGGAFLLVAGAIAGNIDVRGLDTRSAQADKAILQALRDAGVQMRIEASKIVMARGALRSFRFDATDCPDLFPPLVALAAYANGVTEIKGVSRLQHKESNRALTLQQEFGKMGIRIALDEDLMYIYGGSGVKGARVHSHNDHRIAMACAVAALRAESPVVIEEAQAVNKSYTDFYQNLRAWGVQVLEES